MAFYPISLLFISFEWTHSQLSSWALFLNFSLVEFNFLDWHNSLVVLLTRLSCCVGDAWLCGKRSLALVLSILTPVPHWEDFWGNHVFAKSILFFGFLWCESLIFWHHSFADTSSAFLLQTNNPSIIFITTTLNTVAILTPRKRNSCCCSCYCSVTEKPG